jgi:hypothetical protein
MNIGAPSVTKNLNVLFLRLMSPYPALSAVMNALNVSCPLAVSRAVVIIHHLLARRHVQAAQAKTVAHVIEIHFAPLW